MLQVYGWILVIFGLFETITNTIYSTKADGIKLAAKQHREVPPTASEKQMAFKVKVMWVIGVTFVATGVMTLLGHTDMTLSVMYILGAFAVYTVAEALYYRYVLSYAFAVFGIGLLAGFLMNM